jgi:two-component system, NtrC family, sensor histidine kinase GlrK
MRLTIYRKMMGGFVLIIIAMIALNASLLYELRRVTSSLRVALGTNVLSVDRAKGLYALLNDQERHAQQFLVSRDTTYYLLFTDAARRFAGGTDSLVSLVTGTEQSAVLSRLNAINNWVFSALTASESGTLLRLNAEGAITVVGDSVQAMRSLLDNLITSNQAVIAARMQAAEQRAGEAFEFAFVLTLGTIVITVLVALLIARTIVEPIRALRKGAARVARGSFDPVIVRSHDETADLAAAFNEMSEQLRRTNEHKAEMMQHITHELRTPLQSLQSVYYLLTEQIAGPITENQKKYLEMLRSNTDRITEFTNQFLDLAKLEAGRMVFRYQPTDLRSSLAEAVENARAVASRNGISVVMEAEELPLLHLDPEKIGQVVRNLLSNAVKYTPDGGTVTARLSKAGNLVRLSVIDTGCGIDPEDLPHLFTKFYQAKNVVKARSKGTGIGLALVRAIIEGHGGTIRVQSAPGEGTTMIVDLPGRDVVAPASVTEGTTS